MFISKEQFDLLCKEMAPIVEKILKERYNLENFINVKDASNGLK